jgi:hypothetical protein
MKWHYVFIMISYVIVGQVSKAISFKQATGQPLGIIDIMITIGGVVAVFGLVVITKYDIQIEYMKERRQKRK